MEAGLREKAPWWKRGVIYHIYPRSFKDSNGDGIGDLPGIIEKLDYLHWLGVDAIWLSPIYPSPMVDFGYDVANYTDVDPLFGTLSDFDWLVQRAHQLGIKVILDFVPNHTSDQHPWFVESRSSRYNAKRDWYIWRDPKPDGSPPNNWLSFFGGSAWTLDEKTDQCYLHSFLPEQPDLNWHNPQVRDAIYDAMHFWLRRGVDGFRLDAIFVLLKDTRFRDEPPNPHFDPAKDPPKMALQNIYSENQPELHEVLRQFRSIVDNYPGNRVTIGEVSYYLSFEELVKFYGNNDELHLPGNFKLLLLPWQAEKIGKYVLEYEKALPDFAWPNYVLSNHDNPRIAYRVGAYQARLAAMLLLTLRGTPFIYYGDEIGLTGDHVRQQHSKDPFGERFPNWGRDRARTPMQWNSERYAGFSNAEPWLPVAPDYKLVNVETYKRKRDSILQLYHQLIHLRRHYAALQLGTYHALNQVVKDCLGYYRQFRDEKIFTLLNFSDKEQKIFLDIPSNSRLILSTYLDREEGISSKNLILRPAEGCVIVS